MLDSIQNIDPHDYEGVVFLAKVVDNNDPLKKERIKVTIPNLFEGAAANLPWCAPKYGRLIASNGQAASFGVPSVGSEVFVEFQQGSPLFPLYVGMPVSSDSRPAEALVNYPNRYGMKDPAGNVWYIDTTSGQREVKFTHASGNFTFTVANNGACTFDVGSGMTINGNVTHNGNLTHLGDTSETGTHTQLGPINATGKIHSDTDVEAVTVKLKTHRHNAVRAGSDDSGPPNP